MLATPTFNSFAAALWETPSIEEFLTVSPSPRIRQLRGDHRPLASRVKVPESAARRGAGRRALPAQAIILPARRRGRMGGYGMLAAVNRVEGAPNATDN